MTPGLVRRRLAFVDTETTGLDPARDRIIEIAVVTLDSGSAEEWTALLNPRTARAAGSRLLQEIGDDAARALPRFLDVAHALRQRLQGALIVAHNARFDYAFLKAEFERANIGFQADVLCSLMLSKKLYGRDGRHDLASLVERHALTPDVRHRALPDARALFELWHRFQRDHEGGRLDRAVDELLAGPVLPAGLDVALVDRLPERPGVYVLHGNGRALHVGRAANLRLHLTNRFRLDRASGSALALCNSIDNITWIATGGELGARLRRVAVAKSAGRAKRQFRSEDTFSWLFTHRTERALVLASMNRDIGPDASAFGMFPTERRARNALSRLAVRQGLCRTLLGLPAVSGVQCTACLPDRGGSPPERLKHLTQAYAALLPWKIRPWPYGCPIVVRERDELHVLDDWRYLGSGRDMAEAVALLDARRPLFDPEIYSILALKLPRIARRRVLRLPHNARDCGTGE